MNLKAYSHILMTIVQSQVQLGNNNHIGLRGFVQHDGILNIIGKERPISKQAINSKNQKYIICLV